MTRKELRQRVERLLQDAENKRWSDTEINGYIDDAQLEFCRLAKTPKTSVSQNLVDVSTRRTGASLSMSGKTATVTLVAGQVHTLAVDDTVLITGSDSSSRNGGHIVTSVPSNTTSTSNFTFVLDQTETGSDSASIIMIETGPVYTKPSSVLEMTSISINGRELAMYTDSTMNNVSNRNISTGYYLNTTLGATPAPFFNVNAFYRVPKWREVGGQVEGAVFSQRSSSSFRIFPLPSMDEHVYIDKEASTKVSLNLTIEGVLNPTALSSDTATPDIPESFQESLVYGSLERAYLKES